MRDEPNKGAVLTQLFYWFLNDYVITIVRSFFYVTESAPYRNQMFYFRKQAWSKLRQDAVQSRAQNVSIFNTQGPT